MDLKDIERVIDQVSRLSKVAVDLKTIMESFRILKDSESQTRLVLINPLLTELGWSTYESSDKVNADYVLLSAEQPIAAIHAKRLGVEIDEDVMLQALLDTDSDSIRFVIVTNGDVWMMSEMSAPEDISMKFTLSADSEYLVALNALKMRRDVLVGSSVPSMGSLVEDSSEEQLPIAPSGVRSGQPSSSWYALNDPDLKPTGATIAAISIGEQETPISHWADTAEAIVNWLFDEGRLTPMDCPLSVSGSGSIYLVNSTPYNADGSRFRNSRRLRNGMWLCTTGSALTHVNQMTYLLRHLGIDSGLVQLKILDVPRRTRGRRVPRIRETRRIASGASRRLITVGDRSVEVKGMHPSSVGIGTRTYRVASWADFTEVVAMWLVASNKLSASDCPVTVTSSTNRCLVNTSPVHQDGTPFRGPRRLPEGLWIETATGANQHMEYADRLLRRFDVDPNNVRVTFD